MNGTKKILNRICFLSIEIEYRNQKLDLKNLEQILEILKKHNLSATLFVTGQVLANYSEQVREWSKDHEIACHSFTHRFWDSLDFNQRKKELKDFIELYQKIFGVSPQGFRAPSHLIDKEGLELLKKQGFLYDSSIVPHYPPLKKYRGYQGKAPLLPYYLQNKEIFEIPVSGQLLGIPLAGSWFTKLPFFIYQILFFLRCPQFITLSIHSWNKLKNFEKIILLLKNKNYRFLNGKQIYQNYR